MLASTVMASAASRGRAVRSRSMPGDERDTESDGDLEELSKHVFPRRSGFGCVPDPREMRNDTGQRSPRQHGRVHYRRSRAPCSLQRRDPAFAASMSLRCKCSRPRASRTYASMAGVGASGLCASRRRLSASVNSPRSIMQFTQSPVPSARADCRFAQGRPALPGHRPQPR